MKSSMLLSQLTMYKKVRMHYLFLEMPKIRITNIQIFFLLSKNCQICTTTSQCVLCGAHTRYVYRKRILVRRSTNENELFFSSSINHNVYPRVSYVFIIYYFFFVTIFQWVSSSSDFTQTIRQKIGSDSRCSRIACCIHL